MCAPKEVRFFQEPGEYERMVDYFLGGGEPFLRGMGIEPSRLPSREPWLRQLLADHERADELRDRIYAGWWLGGDLVGHCSVNEIRVGEEAFLHLHHWRPAQRRAGQGTEFVRLSARLFWDRLRLRRIYSEPFAENLAPNRVFAKLGFSLTRTYRTTPGKICFEQTVNRWVRSERP